MAEYNPFKDFNPAFTQYQYLKTPKVTIKNPVFGNQEFSDGFIERNGTYIAPPNTPETQEYVTNNYDDLFKEMGNRHSESSNSINTNIGDRPKQAVQFFVDNGYTLNQAKGIVGNLMHESGDPTLNNISNIGDKGTSFGMAQWHDTSKGVGRWTNLKNYAKELGKSENDFETQLKFILKELKDNQSWDKGLKATTTVEGATKWFMEKFENPAKSSAAFSNRLKYANLLS